MQALGQHQLKAGFNFARNSYDGNQIFDPVEVLGVSNRLVERIDFSAPSRLNVDQNEYAFFIQDKWTVWPRLTVDLGLRFDRDSIAEENNLAPRLGFAYLLTKDSKTVLRGGMGLFYDRVNLNIPTFLDLPARTETRFAPSGSVTETWAYQHRLLGPIQNPRSLGWSLQLDREIIPDLFLRRRISTTQHHAKLSSSIRTELVGQGLSDTWQQWARSLSGVRSHRPLSFGREDSFDCFLRPFLSRRRPQ